MNPTCRRSPTCASAAVGCGYLCARSCADDRAIGDPHPRNRWSPNCSRRCVDTGGSDDTRVAPSDPDGDRRCDPPPSAGTVGRRRGPRLRRRPCVPTLHDGAESVPPPGRRRLRRSRLGAGVARVRGGDHRCGRRPRRDVRIAYPRRGQRRGGHRLHGLTSGAGARDRHARNPSADRPRLDARRPPGDPRRLRHQHRIPTGRRTLRDDPGGGAARGAPRQRRHPARRGALRDGPARRPPERSRADGGRVVGRPGAAVPGGARARRRRRGARALHPRCGGPLTALRTVCGVPVLPLVVRRHRELETHPARCDTRADGRRDVARDVLVPLRLAAPVRGGGTVRRGRRRRVVRRRADRRAAHRLRHRRRPPVFEAETGSSWRPPRDD